MTHYSSQGLLRHVFLGDSWWLQHLQTTEWVYILRLPLLVTGVAMLFATLLVAELLPWRWKQTPFPLHQQTIGFNVIFTDQLYEGWKPTNWGAGPEVGLETRGWFLGIVWHSAVREVYHKTRGAGLCALKEVSGNYHDLSFFVSFFCMLPLVEHLYKPYKRVLPVLLCIFSNHIQLDYTEIPKNKYNCYYD